ncbi:hypothetical protein BH18ACT9_BH18ACT9_09170 [soil metagenome]
MPTDLPVSARLALWFTAWVGGHASLDEARDAVLGDDAAHDVVGLPGQPESVPLILALGLLRSQGGRRAALALPVPGDLLGLAGPASFNGEALDAGEGVVVDGAGLGLVPTRVGAAVQWTCHSAHTALQVPDPGEADAGLRQALLSTAERLAVLDVARWRPDAADALMDLRHPVDLVLPRAVTARAVRLAGLATRCRTVVDLAMADDGGSVTTYEADARRDALRPLDHAARRGLVAACAYPWQG